MNKHQRFAIATLATLSAALLPAAASPASVTTGSNLSDTGSEDTTAPNTTITQGADIVKTKHHNASVTFTFTATEAGSTFQCSVGGAAYEACSSPFTATVPATRKPSQYNFAVVATDAAGNKDPSAATDLFAVKRTQKEKHH